MGNVIQRELGHWPIVKFLLPPDTRQLLVEEKQGMRAEESQEMNRKLSEVNMLFGDGHR